MGKALFFSMIIFLLLIVGCRSGNVNNFEKLDSKTLEYFKNPNSNNISFKYLKLKPGYSVVETDGGYRDVPTHLAIKHDGNYYKVDLKNLPVIFVPYTSNAEVEEYFQFAYGSTSFQEIYFNENTFSKFNVSYCNLSNVNMGERGDLTFAEISIFANYSELDHKMLNIEKNSSECFVGYFG